MANNQRPSKPPRLSPAPALLPSPKAEERTEHNPIFNIQLPCWLLVHFSGGRVRGGYGFSAELVGRTFLGLAMRKEDGTHESVVYIAPDELEFIQPVTEERARIANLTEIIIKEKTIGIDHRRLEPGAVQEIPRPLQCSYCGGKQRPLRKSHQDDLCCDSCFQRWIAWGNVNNLRDQWQTIEE
jgi:hypothetical protein